MHDYDAKRTTVGATRRRGPHGEVSESENRRRSGHLSLVRLTLVHQYRILHPLHVFEKHKGSAVQDAVNLAVFGKEILTNVDEFFKIVDRDMKGDEVPMSNFKGSVLCVVNVASK